MAPWSHAIHGVVTHVRRHCADFVTRGRSEAHQMGLYLAHTKGARLKPRPEEPRESREPKEVQRAKPPRSPRETREPKEPREREKPPTELRSPQGAPRP